MKKDFLHPTDGQEAFEIEALPHLDVLYRAAQRMTKNRMDAQDLVQETLLRAFRSWDRFEQGSNCRAWLLKILRNQCINEYRSQSYRPLPLNVDDVDDNYIYYKATPGKDQMTPEQQFFAKVLDDDITTAVDGLRDEFKCVVVLFFLKGYSYREIAHETNLPLGTVRSRLYRGRQLLQFKLGNYAKRNRFIASDTK